MLSGATLNKSEQQNKERRAAATRQQPHSCENKPYTFHFAQSGLRIEEKLQNMKHNAFIHWNLQSCYFF